MVVTRMARSGWDWVRKFSDLENTLMTGVYNSQWMVMDYWKFQTRNLKGTAPSVLPPFTLMIVETAPGSGAWKDATQHLMTYGFWASFNEAAFVDTQHALEGTGILSLKQIFEICRMILRERP